MDAHHRVTIIALRLPVTWYLEVVVVVQVEVVAVALVATDAITAHHCTQSRQRLVIFA